MKNSAIKTSIFEKARNAFLYSFVKTTASMKCMSISCLYIISVNNYISKLKL